MTAEEQKEKAMRLFDERIEEKFFGQLAVLERLGEAGEHYAAFLAEVANIEGLVMRRFFAEPVVKSLQKVGSKAWLVNLVYEYIAAEMSIDQRQIKVKVNFGARSVYLISPYLSKMLELQGIHDLESLLDYHLSNLQQLDKQVAQWLEMNGKKLKLLGGYDD